MKSIPMLAVACSLVVAVAAGALCSALQGSDMRGGEFLCFVTGMIATVAGGCGILIPAAWVVDRMSEVDRRDRPCL